MKIIMIKESALDELFELYLNRIILKTNPSVEDGPVSFMADAMKELKERIKKNPI